MGAKLLSVVKSGWFVTALGLLLFALLVWFGGPYLGLGDSQPLASPWTRLGLILVVVLLWVAVRLLRQLRERAKTGKMASELAGQERGGGDRAAAERTALQARFQEAVDTLRKKRGGGRNLYQLPWYVIIGPPGSGKSTLLLNSGLNFPLSNKFGKDALRGIGGTRNCDWWFTDQAVFLDTAGRYTTQDSDRGADASAWEEFLKLLRRYRKRRPINGVIVAMSLSDLLVLDEQQRQEHIAAIRSRLEELAKHLRIGVPAYLMFTKSDLVAGFTEFFDDLSPEARNQVWGVSFPVEATTDGSAARLFHDEFGLLLDRLNARVLDRLHAERDRQRRAAILSFPQQLGSLQQIARQFVEGVFAPNDYATPLLLRGAYLTSGTQEGTPIDRMMSAVARTFGLDASRVQAPAAQSRTFFVGRLLRDVMFKESGFAGTDPKLERQKIALQLGAFVGVLAITVLLIAGFATSYARNARYLADVQTALDGYSTKDSLSLAPNRPAYFALVLGRLEALSGALETARQHDGKVPLTMRLGLYQGRATSRELQDAYLREINGILLPGVMEQFRSALAANAGDPQLLYYYLKGYLMFGLPEHLDREQLATLANTGFQKLYPSDPVLQQAMARHFGAILAEPGRLRAQTLDDTLVEQARNTLRTADLPALVYGALKLDAAGSGQAPLRLDKQLGLLGGVFRRQSGVALTEPFPALYTQPVFRDQAAGGIEQAVARFVGDDWVFGATKIDDLEKARYARDVLGLYTRDYVAAWDQLLGDLQLQPVTSIAQASDIAAKLAGPNSPLKLFLKLLRDNTTDLLRAPPPDSAAAAGAANAAEAAEAATQAAEKKLKQNALARALAGAAGAAEGAPGAQPGAAITEHFELINKLTEGAPGSQPIDQTVQVLDGLSKVLLTMGDFSSGAGAPNPQLLLAQQAAGQLPPPVSGWVASLTGKSAALAASGAKGAIDDQFAQMVATDCASYTRNRYPFAPGSATDIPLQNFGELFGFGGAFDTFYKTTLDKLVDASGPTWRWKSGPGAVAGSPGMLGQMQAADRIKQMFFRGSNVPEVGFSLLNPALDPGIGRFAMEVDGQKFEYAGGVATIVPMKWPGPTPGRVSVAGFDAAGNLLARFDYAGDWALFRALQAARLQRESDVRYRASFDFGGKAVQLTLQASSLKNPFLRPELQTFRCGG